ncbi:MAG: molybdopterin molybdotransferase MoeA [Iamia sp.]
MQPLPEVRAEVLARCAPLPAEHVTVRAARGSVVVDDVTAPADLPGFASSAMDGFAVRAADVAGASETVPVVLEVVETVMAGRAPTKQVGARQAVRIMTGAPVPDGADAIVPVEVTRHSDGVRDDDETVAILAPSASGQHLRGAGDDARAGTVVVRAGSTVTAPLIGVLTAIGATHVEVVPRPRVGVISTGDELVEPTRGLERGQIRDSNRPMLLAAVAEAGGVPVNLGWVRDDADAVAAALRAGAHRCDLLLTSGGVSMGEADVVKMVLDRMVDPRWFQIALRPAKPFALASVGEVPLLGLPGNPVSALLSFEVLARPAIRRLGGHEELDRPRVTARAGAGLDRRPDGKLHLVRVRLTRGEAGAWTAEPVPHQGSHQLVATAGATGLALVHDGPGVAEGEPVEVLVLDPTAALAALAPV